MSIELYDYQKEALDKIHTGCILNGGVGSGKSRTALAYFFTKMEGQLKPFKKPKRCKKLYIITTAKKRDSLEWEEELCLFLLDDVVIDSWNNIKKYENVKYAFFIFDEDRVCGKGAWVKSFLKITAGGYNDWIILSATPGDTWSDYIPVFIANGFYKNRTEFNLKHVVWDRYTRYPKVSQYLHQGQLIAYRKKILVNMDFDRKTVPHHEEIMCGYDRFTYKQVFRDRFDIFENKPITDAAGLCYCLRRVVNSDPSRVSFVIDKAATTKRIIVFYNYNYELDQLKEALCGFTVAEWNGHKHEEIPDGDEWIYLVQYGAGAEGWNCIRSDTIIFYSQSYSYKQTAQAAGRIDRVNTPYHDLYYYHLSSTSSIDIAIKKALSRKKRFNESDFVKF